MSHSIAAARNTYVNVRVNEGVKHKAEKILKKLGLSMSDAVNMLINQINVNKGIPFELKIPNEETLKAFEESEKNINCSIYKNPKEMYDALGLK